MSHLKSRWINDPLYQFILKSFMDPKLGPEGMTWKEWFATAPKIPHPAVDELLDCRGLHLEFMQIGPTPLDAAFFDGSVFRSCAFNGTFFCNSSAANCDFTSSRFIGAQMSPIYAPGAIFKDCVFQNSFLMGIGPANYSKGALSDLRGCDFTGVRAYNTGFDRCDFRGANLSQARFTNCELFGADLRGVDLSGAQFERCEFLAAQLDDTPSVRAWVQMGNNLNIDKIEWNR